jgi:siderophore synthetase component
MNFELRQVDPTADAELLHGWVTHKKSVFWMMQDAAVADVLEEYRGIDETPTHDALIGLHNGEPAFLVERYDPAHDEIGEHYDVQDGDVGMHFLVAPTDTPISGFTRAVITHVMEWLFEDPAAKRVVVEPDATNTAVHALNEAVGFGVVGEVPLAKKTALLSVCTRTQFEARKKRLGADFFTAHLRPEPWAEANRLLVRKALSEFAHERLFTPEPQPNGSYRVGPYSFAARRMALDHWQIAADSIRRDDGAPLDALQLVTDLREQLGLQGEQLGLYLEEVTGTLSALAYKLDNESLSADELAVADHQTIESRMIEGHPCFVANSGRLGFDAADYLRYAPEAAQPVQLLWVAAHKEWTTFSAGDGVQYEAFLERELGAATLKRFDRTMGDLGLDLHADYLLIPVHPWQWYTRLAVTFAGDVARRRLVCLGHGNDEYVAQQSIRTFFNHTAGSKHYVKTAIAVVNMGFVRGLSAKYMNGTPAINDWVAELVESDDLLADTGFRILRERASVGYHAEAYAADDSARAPYPKMLAALWRESPVPQIEKGERLATMASLLHVDTDGRSLAGALIERSGLDPDEWLRSYLDAYLRPLLHCFYEYDLVFMPHGENLILVLEDDVPVRVIMKDIAEEVVLMDPSAELPPAVERIRAEVPDELKPLSILTDVFDCFFRFLGAILSEAEVIDEDGFWRAVAECVARYQDDAPHLRGRFEKHDLFTEEFELSCLNRLQLRDSRQMVDLQDPAGSLQLHGTLANPLALFAPARA